MFLNLVRMLVRTALRYPAKLELLLHLPPSWSAQGVGIQLLLNIERLYCKRMQTAPQMQERLEDTHMTEVELFQLLLPAVEYLLLLRFLSLCH